MGTGKIDKFVKEWIEIQEYRALKMCFNNVRVYNKHKQYYASVKFFRENVIIKAIDAEMGIKTLDESQLQGFAKDGSKGLILNRRFNKPNIKLIFRTSAERQKAEKKLQEIIGDETTSESSPSPTESSSSN